MSTSKSIAGIQEVDDARVIPVTRRPDGTYRKERKVRPGYTPPEDVAKYSNRVLDSARPALTPAIVAATSSTPKTKAQIKNDKRKAKRKDEATVTSEGSQSIELNKTDEAADTGTDNADKSSTQSKIADVTTTTADADTAPVDPEKRLRALNKKVKQAEQLKERQQKGEAMLPEQLEKISRLQELLVQIAELSL
ncbi:hypothetical protein BGZ99_009332 [Dissophora globulifera]|uniref:WIBG Mago-binding domain-containing protein n=1 Tax=Dissophora globulifera TaxID=979702 RepID=A0A9P6R9J8_9FUNG|nr:hypothetical protein BGZ99_009332 [Dissophora globulifera]